MKPTLVERLRAAPASTFLIVVNVTVFVLAERAGSTTSPETLVEFGATWRNLVWQGEYWRLVTSMFLHIGAIHLLWNGYWGFLISAQVEQAIGGRKFLALYLLSGIAGSSVSVIGHDALSAGASGALFGLIGWQVATLRMRAGSFRVMWHDLGTRNQLQWIGFWFLIGAFAGFDNYAHAGGLVLGLCFALALAAQGPRRMVSMGAVLLGLSVAVALASHPLPWLYGDDLMLRDAYRKQDDPAAVIALTEPLLGSPRHVEALRLRCRALLALNRYEEAIRAADEVIAREPTDAIAYLYRGGARSLGGDVEGSEADFKQALNLDESESTRNSVASYRRARPGAVLDSSR
jgi:rhomboid protease GluP